MTSNRVASLAAVTLASVIAGGLGGCEKSVDQGGPPPPLAEDLPPAVASTVPSLPVLAAPNFAPDFVATVGDANLLDQAEAQLALRTSTDGQVKAFASQVLAAHAKLAADLATAINASGSRISAPESPSELAQTKVLLLGRQQGAAFDKAYLADAAESQGVFYSAVRDYARFGDAPALKAYAARALKDAEQRMKAAQALKNQVK